MTDINDNTFAITDWIELSDNINSNFYAATILISQSMPFEFPRKVADFISELDKRGIALSKLIASLQIASFFSDNKKPTIFIFGCPMRGIKGSEDLKQHITAWELDDTGKGSIDISTNIISDNDKLYEIGKRGLEIFKEWTDIANLKWCYVYEDRDEIVTRRDYL